MIFLVVMDPCNVQDLQRVILKCHKASASVNMGLNPSVNIHEVGVSRNRSGILNVLKDLSVEECV